LKLADGDYAFSASTRGLLEAACRVPVGVTMDDEPLVGPASILRAALSMSALERVESPKTLAGALIDQVIVNQGPADEIRQRLAELIPRKTGDEVVQRAVADADLSRMLADAAVFVRRILKSQIRVDASHALAAALRTPTGQRTLDELGLTGTDRTRFFNELSTTTRDYVLVELKRGEMSDTVTPALDEFLEAVRNPVPPLLPASVSETRYVADLPARSLGEDRLGMADEARALAEVVCLREPGPPLAIGLFGDWGSGKSTFMNMLEAAIEELTDRTETDEEARRTLVSKVVHIRFNAWHYNDANLWASLSSEFFAQLRSGGSEARSGDTYASLVKDVLQRVAKLDDDSAESGNAAAEAMREAEKLRAEVKAIHSRQRVKGAEALAETVEELISSSTGKQILAMRDALVAAGQTFEMAIESSSDPEVVREALKVRLGLVRTEVRRAAGLKGRAAFVVRSVGGALIGRGKRRLALPIFGGLALGLLIVVLWSLFLPAQFAGFVVAGVTFLATAGRAVANVYRAVEPIFRAADRYVERLIDGRDQYAREIADKQEQLRNYEEKVAAAEAARARKSAEAARFRGGTPDQVFDYYLNFSDVTRQFEQHLGTVSQVRRAFEQLDAIFRERDRLRRESNKSDLQTARVKHLNAVTAGIDRIVLYIDDLDRCQVQQVVRVLEAVHLLLAFPLFVVVVGVDSRWLQHSLLEFYHRQLRDVRAPDGEGAVQTIVDHRATVQDYLEKIFQIPIRLESTRSFDPHFRSYLESVAGPTSLRVEDDAGSAEYSSPGAGGDAVRLRPISVRLKPVDESARATLERITLHKEEIEFAATLAPFLNRSPRAVKRFMNIYRLLRGLHRGEALDRFLARTDHSPPLFAAFQFWLALDNGLRPEEVALYRLTIRELAAARETLETLAGWLNEQPGTEADMVSTAESAREQASLLRQGLQSSTIENHVAALRAMSEILSGVSGPRVLLECEETTRRFSMRQS
jgi:hypothetical protein